MDGKGGNNQLKINEEIPREIKYKEGDVVIITNKYQKLTLRNHTSKERNQRKELSIKKLRNIILNWCSTRNKSTLWLCYQVKLLF